MEPEFVGGRGGHHASSPNTQDTLSEKLLGGSVLDDEEEQQHQSLIVEDAVARNASTGGEKQPPAYRDVWAAILFGAVQIGMFYLAMAWGIPALQYHNNTDDTNTDSSIISFTGLLLLSVTCSVAALVLSAVALAVLMRAASQLIQISLLLTVICDGIVTAILAVQGVWMGTAIAGLFWILAIWYAWAVWHRIPFAAANLQTALCAVQANAGLIVVAYGMTLAVNLFSVVWLLAWLGAYVRSADCSSGTEQCISHMHPVVVGAFLLCYYWTAEVGKNVLTVTTAGVVGTYWFVPDQAATFCSPAVTDSLIRASTYSAGSICLGSLLTAVLQLLHHLADHARRHGSSSHRGNDFLLCVLECIVGFLERLVAYFNKWAYGT